MSIIKKIRGSVLGRQLKESKQIVLTVFWMSVIADIFFIPKNSDLIIFMIILLYVFLIFFYNLKNSLLFKAGILLVFVMYVSLLINGTSISTEKAAVWLFFCMLVGIIQGLKE